MNGHDELDGINESVGKHDVTIISDRANLVKLEEAASKIVRDSLVRIFLCIALFSVTEDSNILFEICTGRQIHFNIWTRKLAISQFFEDLPLPTDSYN